MTKHLLIGGSTAARTLACPAWVKRNEYHKPSERSNTHADEGNLLHDAMENYYDQGKSFMSQVGNLQYKGIPLTKDHLPLLRSARNQVEDVFDEFHVEEFYCEPFVQYEDGRIGGSIDILALSKNSKTAIILDYKFGRNKVSAQDNAQMKFYAMCAAADDQFSERFRGVPNWALVIVQPRCSDEPDIFECSNKDIVAFENDILTALESPDKAKTGPDCKYCPVQPYCPEKKAEAAKALILSKTSATSLGQSWQLAQDLKSWIKEVEYECKTKLEQGADIPDLKLVAGKRTREWLSPRETLLECFGPDILETSLLTPAKAEKKFSKKDVASHVKTNDGKPTVAHVTDKREPISIDIQKKFENIVVKDSTLFNN